MAHNVARSGPDRVARVDRRVAWIGVSAVATSRRFGRVACVSDRVTVTMDGGVADVRMNRADKMNALDGAMFAALVETADALAADASVRAVVLSGEGRSFCAGLDFSSFSAMASGNGARVLPTGADPDDPSRLEGRLTHQGQQAVWGWQTMPVPVIAAVHGHALGGGCQIALGADLRFVTADAAMSVLEIRWGLVPDMCGTVLLERLVGLDVAKELTFTGRMVSGEEAVRIGLATRVCADPRADALALAHEIAQKSPSAVRASKRLLNGLAERSTGEALREERREIRALIGAANQVEAVTAFFEKRPPVFADPA